MLNGVKLIKGVLRVHLLALDNNIAGRIPPPPSPYDVVSPTRCRLHYKVFTGQRWERTVPDVV